MIQPCTTPFQPVRSNRAEARLRIYDGTPRQDYEEVFRAIGAVLDKRGFREVLLAEVPDGFLIQGLTVTGSTADSWSDSLGRVTKETVTFLDDDISQYMEEAVARRGKGRTSPSTANSNYYEQAFRLIGRYVDEQRPRDVFFLEQEGSFVVRLLISDQTGTRHRLSEFTRDDIVEMIGRGPSARGRPGQKSQT